MSTNDSPLPYVYDKDKADEIWAILTKLSKDKGVDGLSEEICGQLFGNSPFLCQIVERMPNNALDILTEHPNQTFQSLLTALKSPRPEGEKKQDLSAFLRTQKAHVSLITAYADVSGLWSLAQVTKALSDFADHALQLALAHLVHEAMMRGELDWPTGGPEPVCPKLAKDAGYFLLGMGKLGAFELNYSSDIDLIALYDPDCVIYRGKKTLAQCWIKITQELMQLMEQRTMYGYVFRTDLRLRPDPGATPVAISVHAAESYYHSMAVNWERSAMIKARVVAGDSGAAERYLSNLSSWVWRRNMDFAALKDIAAIKNQINRHYDQMNEVAPGYNVKLGIGGIREIEFFAQINQLLYAGRHPSLRVRNTITALKELARLKLISNDVCDTLESAYQYLRTLEHRIQMVEDAQTHELPHDGGHLDRIACFMKHEHSADLMTTLKECSRKVSAIYDSLLPEYSANESANFSEKMLPAELAKLGFLDCSGATAMIEGWRRGRHLALRTERAKSLLEQCLPKLLKAFGETDNPCAALVRFDRFLSQLPTGVQLFSLLHSNPSLFTLIARVMGLAPALADTLAKKPELWDMVLEPSFYAPIEEEATLREELEIRLSAARDFQDILDFVRRFVAEQKFRAGVHLLESLAGVEESGAALTRVADVVLKILVPHVSSEFARRHGVFPNGGIAILAMGKYGGKELTHTSDLDIVFLYHADDMSAVSDGAKPLTPSQYFSRLGQNIITAITALTSEGRLFEVDTRLRPSGGQGPLVVTLKTFQDYYAQSAWTWEHMALTRARLILAPEAIKEPLMLSVKKVLVQKRNLTELVRAVDDMRGKLFKQFGSYNKWAVKYCEGGLVDMEFICQYLMLKNGHKYPDIFEPELSRAIRKLEQHGLVNAGEAAILENAHQLMQKTQSLLRLSVGTAPEDASHIPAGLQTILLKANNCEDMAALEQKLEHSQCAIYKLYEKLIAKPASNAS